MEIEACELAQIDFGFLLGWNGHSFDSMDLSFVVKQSYIDFMLSQLVLATDVTRLFQT